MAMSTLALAVIPSLGGSLGNLTVDSGKWHAACGRQPASASASAACLSGTRLRAHLTMLRNLCRYGNASALGQLGRLVLLQLELLGLLMLPLLGRPAAACLIMPLMDCS